MTLLQRIYDHFTTPIIAENDRKRKEAKTKTFKRDSKARRSKFEYREKCVHFRKIEKQLDQELEEKLKKWNWLKRLC